MELAIKGHSTRGEEVISLFEMLGGRNPHNYSADSDDLCFYIGKGINDTNVIYYDWTHCCYDDEEWIVFTLEEFEKKFPYKVGDKVQHKGATSCGTVYEIEQMIWEDNQVKYIICDLYWKANKCIVTTEDLQPYKEETMDEKIQAYEITGEICANEVAIEFDPSKFEMIERNGKYFVVKKQPQYPKTYKECCEVLMGKTNFQDFELVLTKLSINQAQSGINIFSPVPPHITLINNFYKLLICRDAYWLLAGKQMGLGEPWKPDWKNNLQHKHYISAEWDEIKINFNSTTNKVLAFPTEEVRNAFIENFKDLIELCKELL